MSDRVIETKRRRVEDGIVATDVSHGFDDTGVLDEISLGLERGEILAVIGPSGTGKTTLLELLAAFYPPDEGEIRMNGGDVWSQSERERLMARRRIGMVFQEPNLFDATVRRNVSYGLHVRRDWRSRIREWGARLFGARTTHRVTDALETVGLADVATQTVRSLSGGEAQRVAFARALAYDPDVLLLDEPTSDLDPRNTALIEEAVGTARNRGIGVAVATHDMHQAERLADRVAVMLDGSLIEVGPAERVFSDPDDPRARRFIDGELVYTAGENGD
ncbi:amino acid ABC transporter ATP-binding protein [Natranaeroarchaeum aerophilus]|uniref:Phosphate ABC transporter ATP-binding protein n=1 Tax=Natranaeroarchaeum aerophilus TaxID=2917711 RepID=A0AAE3K613_9EURY|nr:phosphate ABC transporter ATP-binding protein [Natranaeroarchaeum aerophilus]MCL9814481.1 phosphate ABC transporter ATP-binding protein [Natranaeroarchaeum aerophilus]